MNLTETQLDQLIILEATVRASLGNISKNIKEMIISCTQDKSIYLFAFYYNELSDDDEDYLEIISTELGSYQSIINMDRIKVIKNKFKTSSESTKYVNNYMKDMGYNENDYWQKYLFSRMENEY